MIDNSIIMNNFNVWLLFKRILWDLGYTCFPSVSLYPYIIKRRWSILDCAVFRKSVRFFRMTRKPAKRVFKIIPEHFLKGAWPWTLLEGRRCFGNQSLFVLNPRLIREVTCWRKDLISRGTKKSERIWHGISLLSAPPPCPFQQSVCYDMMLQC